MNNPHISLTIVDENNNIVYHSINNSIDKAKIVKINDHRYAGIKPDKTKEKKLIDFLKSHTHEEIQNILMKKIIY